MLPDPGPRSRPRFHIILLLAILVITVSLILFVSQQWKQAEQHAVRVGKFQVIGNKIIDPSGKPFIIRGVDAVYGLEAGGDRSDLGMFNYQHAQSDFDTLKKVWGINFIRFAVDGGTANNPTQLHEIDNVIKWANQRGFVVEIAQYDKDTGIAIKFTTIIAKKYKNNPYLWIEPINEPGCGGPHCYDWSYWQQQQNRLVQAIRATGFQNPIVVNPIAWGSNCSQLATYHLGDTNVIYGCHRYGGQLQHINPSEEYQRWANPAYSARFAMIIDEMGVYNGPGTYSLSWGQEFLDYAANWINKEQGDGFVGFMHRFADPSSMVVQNGTGLTRWGQIFINHLLKKISLSAAA